jgi:hypothetical protein
MKLQDILWTAAIAVAAIIVAKQVPGLKDML